MVQDRKWLTEAEFLAGLGLCQVFPGVNVINVSIWLGYRLHGNLGAIIGPCAMALPPAVVIIAIAELFLNFSKMPSVNTALAGVAAAAIGLGAAMGMRAGRRCLTPLPAAIMATSFLAVGVLHLPLVAVLLVLAPISIVHAWRTL